MPSYYRGKKRTTTANPFEYIPEIRVTRTKKTYLPPEEFRPPLTTTTTTKPTTTTNATELPPTTTRASLRKNKKFKLDDDSDTDGFSIDF